MDVAVDEDAAGELGVCDEEAARVVFVACLGSEDGGAADGAVGGEGVGIQVRGIEAAGETAHYFDVRVAGCGGEDLLALVGCKLLSRSNYRLKSRGVVKYVQHPALCSAASHTAHACLLQSP